MKKIKKTIKDAASTSLQLSKTIGVVGGNTAAKIKSKAFAAKSAVMDKVSTIGDMTAIAQMIEQMQRFKSGFGKYSDAVISPILTNGYVHSALLKYLGKLHNHSSENQLIRTAMDRLAQVEGYGGAAFHRISDGRHSVLGAIEAMNKELAEIPAIERISGAMLHLWHDFHTAVGIPILSFKNHEQFQEVCKALHISPRALQDLLATNSTELLGSALTVIPVLYRLDKMQTADFVKVATRAGIVTVGGGKSEIIGSLFCIALIGKAFYEVYKKGDSTTDLLLDAAKEGGWTGASVVSFALLPLPVSLSISVVLPILRSKIETDGVDGAIQSCQEYWDSMSSWLDQIEQMEPSSKPI